MEKTNHAGARINSHGIVWRLETDTNRRARKEKKKEKAAAGEGSHSLILCRLVVALHHGAKGGLVVGRLESDADLEPLAFQPQPSSRRQAQNALC